MYFYKSKFYIFILYMYGNWHKIPTTKNSMKVLKKNIYSLCQHNTVVNTYIPVIKLP